MSDIKIDDNCLFEVERRQNVHLNSNKLEQLENQHAEKLECLGANDVVRRKQGKRKKRNGVISWLRCRAALQMYHVQLLDRRMPDHRIFQRLHRQLRETHSLPFTRHDADLQRAIRNPSLEESILNFEADRPKSSTRAVLPITFQVIYSQFGLAIHQNDHQARRRFVEWAQNEIAVVPDFHKRILFSDEAHFWLNGYVNKQNCRIWSEANPQVYVETPLHPEKLTVWCALWAGGILLRKR
ncbi:hypothetical protein TNCV_926451 [Trichonephila clavipes]|nr:hypothetical protein TNCV_926451 [Trichonephila clavipes]